MNINDALNLLSLPSTATQAEIKKAFKAASLKFHPDRNPAGAQMMIAINAAYDTLKNLGDSVKAHNDFKQTNYAEELNEVLNSLLVLEGLILEVCGNWIWISGDTKQHAKRLGRKEGGLGCFYASKKKKWYFRPDEYKSRSRKSTDMNEIRAKYGSTTQFKTTRRAITA
jgi:curved DNA-binding protein CbpA